MAIPALQTLLTRVDDWPEERQERLAALIAHLDAEDDALTVSDEDAAEIRRRMNDPSEPTMSLAEFQDAFADHLR